MSTAGSFHDLLSEQITAAALAAAVSEELGDGDLAESWRRRVDHLVVYLDGTRLLQTGRSPGLRDR
jgi:hypothetical protein